MKSIELKIKIKSLLAEQQIIRKEEAKIIRSIDYYVGKGQLENPALERTLQSIRGHRRIKIRHAVRYAGLCRAYIRGQSYRAIENKTRPGNEVSPGTLIAEINRFHGSAVKTEDVNRWLAEVQQQQAAA